MQSTPKIIASLFNSSSGKKSSDNAEILVFAAIALFIFIFAATCNFITLLTRFSVSRNREFMADAGSAEMTRNPLALASALRKIADNPCVETVSQKIVAQLFIANPLKTGNKPPKKMFASHPPIEKRIEMLEQF